MGLSSSRLLFKQQTKKKAGTSKCGVLEYELGVALGRKWPDKVQLALWQIYQRLLVAGAEDELSDCERETC